MISRQVGISGELFYQRERFTSQFNQSQVSANSGETYGVQWGVSAFIF